MHLTKKSEYALSALAFLASRAHGETVPLVEIAGAQDLPRSFLAKICQQLAGHGLLDVARGPGSGYALARPPASITILDVLAAAEGPRLHQRCLFWERRCAEEHPCPLHQFVKVLTPQLRFILENSTLADYTAGRRPEKAAAPRLAGLES